MLSTPPAFTLSQDQTLHKITLIESLKLTFLYYFTNYKIITQVIDKNLCFTIKSCYIYNIFHINIYSYFTSVINNRLQEFYIRFIKITLQTFIIIFKDHPLSIVTSLISLPFDAFQSNWTGIIIDYSPFVNTFILKFSLNFWILRFLLLLLAFY